VNLMFAFVALLIMILVWIDNRKSYNKTVNNPKSYINLTGFKWTWNILFLIEVLGGLFVLFVILFEL